MSDLENETFTGQDLLNTLHLEDGLQLTLLESPLVPIARLYSPLQVARELDESFTPDQAKAIAEYVYQPLLEGLRALAQQQRR